MLDHLLSGRICVLGHRIHHGTIGAALVICARRPSVRMVGLALMLHDIEDRRVWLPHLIRYGG